MAKNDLYDLARSMGIEPDAPGGAAPPATGAPPVTATAPTTAAPARRVTGPAAASLPSPGGDLDTLARSMGLEPEAKKAPEPMPEAEPEKPGVLAKLGESAPVRVGRHFGAGVMDVFGAATVPVRAAERGIGYVAGKIGLPAVDEYMKELEAATKYYERGLDKATEAVRGKGSDVFAGVGEKMEKGAYTNFTDYAKDVAKAIAAHPLDAAEWMAETGARSYPQMLVAMASGGAGAAKAMGYAEKMGLAGGKLKAAGMLGGTLASGAAMAPMEMTSAQKEWEREGKGNYLHAAAYGILSGTIEGLTETGIAIRALRSKGQEQAAKLLAEKAIDTWRGVGKSLLKSGFSEGMEEVSQNSLQNVFGHYANEKKDPITTMEVMKGSIESFLGGFGPGAYMGGRQALREKMAGKPEETLPGAKPPAPPPGGGPAVTPAEVERAAEPVPGAPKTELVGSTETGKEPKSLVKGGIDLATGEPVGTKPTAMQEVAPRIQEAVNEALRPPPPPASPEQQAAQQEQQAAAQEQAATQAAEQQADAREETKRQADLNAKLAVEEAKAATAERTAAAKVAETQAESAATQAEAAVTPAEVPEGPTWVPTAELRRPNGEIGTQGVTEDGVRGVLENLAGMTIPEGASMKQMVEAFKGSTEAKKALIDATMKDPIDVGTLPDGTRNIRDGHHRAFLLAQAGFEEIPTFDSRAEKEAAKAPAGPAATLPKAEAAAPPPAAAPAPTPVQQTLPGFGAAGAVAPAPSPPTAPAAAPSPVGGPAKAAPPAAVAARGMAEATYDQMVSKVDALAKAAIEAEKAGDNALSMELIRESETLDKKAFDLNELAAGMGKSEPSKVRGGKQMYFYGATLRPIAGNGVPKGFNTEFTFPTDNRFPHGVVAYDRPLTDKEMETFDLQPTKAPATVAYESQPLTEKKTEKKAETGLEKEKVAKPTKKTLESKKLTEEAEKKQIKTTGLEKGEKKGVEKDAKKAREKAIDKLGEMITDSSPKGRAVKYAEKLAEQGLIPKHALTEIKRIAKDRDMTIDDVAPEVQYWLENPEERGPQGEQQAQWKERVPGEPTGLPSPRVAGTGKMAPQTALTKAKQALLVQLRDDAKRDPERGGAAYARRVAAVRALRMATKFKPTKAQQVAERIAERLGRNIVWLDPNQMGGGFFSPVAPNTIFLSTRGNFSPVQVALHEIKHALDFEGKTNPEVQKILDNFTSIVEKAAGKTSAERAKWDALYAEQMGYTPDEVEAKDEWEAEIWQDAALKPEFYERLKATSQKLFDAVVGAYRSIVQSIYQNKYGKQILDASLDEETIKTLTALETKGQITPVKAAEIWAAVANVIEEYSRLAEQGKAAVFEGKGLPPAEARAQAAPRGPYPSAGVPGDIQAKLNRLPKAVRLSDVKFVDRNGVAYGGGPHATSMGGEENLARAIRSGVMRIKDVGFNTGIEMGQPLTGQQRSWLTDSLTQAKGGITVDAHSPRGTKTLRFGTGTSPSQVANDITTHYNGGTSVADRASIPGTVAYYRAMEQSSRRVPYSERTTTSEQQKKNHKQTITVGVDPDVLKPNPPLTRFSRNTLPAWREEFIVAARDAGWEEAQIFQAVKNAEYMAAVMGKDENMIPEELYKSPLLDNSFELPLGKSVDFSGVCPKSAKEQAYVAAIAKNLYEMGHSPHIGREEVLMLNQRLKDMGEKASCRTCYVLQKLRDRSEMGRSFFDWSKADFQENIPNSTFLVGMGKERDKGSIDDRDAIMKLMEEKGIKKREIENAFYISDMDFISQDPRLERLFEMYNTYLGGAKASKIFPDVFRPYTTEILKMSALEVRAANKSRGMRWSGFTDVEGFSMLDLAQSIADAATQNLVGYQYTKVPEVAAFMADTNMKMNLSLFLKGDVVGSIEWDNVDGMPIDDARKLIALRPGNMGIMVVALNDAQVDWALDNPEIGLIIPNHVGGTEKEMFSRVGISDFTREGGFKSVPVKGLKLIRRGADKGKLIEYVQKKGKPLSKEVAVKYLDQSFFKYWLERNGWNGPKAAEEMRQFFNERDIMLPFQERWGDHPNYYKLLTDFAAIGEEQMVLEPNFRMDAFTELWSKYVKDGGAQTRTFTDPQITQQIAAEIASMRTETGTTLTIEKALEPKTKMAAEERIPVTEDISLDPEGNVHIDQDTGVVYVGADLVHVNRKGQPAAEGILYPDENNAFTVGGNEKGTTGPIAAVKRAFDAGYKTVVVVGYKNLLGSMESNPLFRKSVRRAILEAYGPEVLKDVYTQAKVAYKQAVRDKATGARKTDPNSIDHYALKFIPPASSGKLLPGKTKPTLISVAKSIAAPGWENMLGKAVGAGRIKSIVNSGKGNLYPWEIKFDKYYKFDNPIDFDTMVGESAKKQLHKDSRWVMMQSATFAMTKDDHPTVDKLIKAAKGEVRLQAAERKVARTKRPGLPGPEKKTRLAAGISKLAKTPGANVSDLLRLVGERSTTHADVANTILSRFPQSKIKFRTEPDGGEMDAWHDGDANEVVLTESFFTKVDDERLAGIAVHEALHGLLYETIPDNLVNYSITGWKYMDRIEDAINNEATPAPLRDLLSAYRDVFNDSYAKSQGTLSMEDLGDPTRPAFAGAGEMPDTDFPHFYGISTFGEFVSEALTNKFFQNYLDTIRVDVTEPSIWERFKTAVRNMFGLNATQLDRILYDFNQMTGANADRLEPRPPTPPEQRPAPAQKTSMRQAMRAFEMQLAARDRERIHRDRNIQAVAALQEEVRLMEEANKQQAPTRLGPGPEYALVDHPKTKHQSFWITPSGKFLEVQDHEIHGIAAAKHFLREGEITALQSVDIDKFGYDLAWSKGWVRVADWRSDYMVEVKGPMTGAQRDGIILTASERGRNTVDVENTGPVSSYETIWTNPKTGGQRALLQAQARTPGYGQYWDMQKAGSMTSFIREIQNRMVDTKDAMFSIEKFFGPMPTDINLDKQQKVYLSMLRDATDEAYRNGVVPILNKIAQHKETIQSVGEYLIMRRVPEYNDLIARRNPTFVGPGSGIDTATAQAYIAAIPADRQARLNEIAALFDDFKRDTHKLMVDLHLESQETIDAWEAENPNWISFEREGADEFGFGGDGTGQGFNVKGTMGKVAAGSALPIQDPASAFASLVSVRERTLKRGIKNMTVGHAAYGAAIGYPNPKFWKAIKPGDVQTPAQIQQLALELQRDLGIDPADIVNLFEEEKKPRLNPITKQIEYRVNPMLRSAYYAFATRVNGEDRFVFFNKRDTRAMEMVKALKGMDTDQMPKFLNWAGRFTKYYAALSTQWNPFFGFKNLGRDALEAMVTLGATPLAKHRHKVFAKIPSSLKLGWDMAKYQTHGGIPPAGPEAALYRRFLKAGGPTGHLDYYENYQERSEDLVKDLAYIAGEKFSITMFGKKVVSAPHGMWKAGRGIKNFIGNYNTAMENATRFATFVTAINELGMDDTDAAILAKEVTVNFNDKGRQTSNFNALFAFFNAAVQGTATLARTMFETGPNGRPRLSSYGKQVAIGGLLLGAMQHMILVAMGHGDDDQPPEWVKDNNLVLPNPFSENHTIMIPLPLGFSFLPSVGRRSVELVSSDFENAPQKMGSMAAMAISAHNPLGDLDTGVQVIVPTPFKPLVSVASNKDWKGMPIAREDFNSLKPTPGYTRVRDTATDWGRFWALALDHGTGGDGVEPGYWSPTPDEVDFLTASYTGGVGREAVKTWVTARALMNDEALPTYRIPGASAYIGTIGGETVVREQYYKNMKKANMQEAQVAAHAKDGTLDKYLETHPEAVNAKAATQLNNKISKLHTVRSRAKKAGDTDVVRQVEEATHVLMQEVNRLMEEGNE